MLYSDFKPDLPLRDSVLSDEKVGDVVYNEVYFNGRQTGEGRVLIYGIYAHHMDGKKHNAILIIPDYNSEPDINIINIYARLGYDVLMFDYKGESSSAENYTHYPSDVKYANLKYSFVEGNNRMHNIDYLNRCDVDARSTCWYEWCCVARYAVSYLKSRIETNKIGVLGIKSGAEIMWHLTASESRINCAVALFGAGWRSYKNIRKYSTDHFEVDDERMRFVAGVDSHAFAPYCRCPVALFTSSNCAEFDADRAHDTILRVNKKVDSFFCLAPRMSEAVNINCTRNIELFFGVYLNGQRIQIASEPIINMSVEGEKIKLKVQTPSEPRAKNVDIYVCENQIVPSRRNWIKLEGVVKQSDTEFSAEYSLINGGEVLFTFAVVEYRNGITVSTPITFKKCPKTAVIKTNLLYSNAQGVGDFMFNVSPADVIADSLFYRRSPLEMVRGPMGINGISGRTGLITFKPNEKCVDIKSDSIFKLDVYCKQEITLGIILVSAAGTDEEQRFNYYEKVPKGEVWQNIVVALKDFKTKDGRQITEPDSIDYFLFSAEGFFAINNVLLI